MRPDTEDLLKKIDEYEIAILKAEIAYLNAKWQLATNLMGLYAEFSRRLESQ
jgi:hypothetical protein